MIGVDVHGRRGASVVELLVALTLGLLLVGFASESLVRLRGVVARVIESTEWLETVRVTRHTLVHDARWSGAEPRIGPDSMGLRVLRGVGRRCGDPDDPDAIHYRGIRHPDPDKDSVRVTRPDGRIVRTRVTEVRTSARSCPEEGVGTRVHWTLDPPVTDGVLMEVFETGSYHLGPRALRYRRAGGSRQPLSPEVLAGASGFASGNVVLAAYPDRPGPRRERLSIGLVRW